MPPEKILIGLPTYGRGWTISKSQYMGPGAPAEGASKATEFVQEPGVSAYYEVGTVKMDELPKMDGVSKNF